MLLILFYDTLFSTENFSERKTLKLIKSTVFRYRILYLLLFSCWWFIRFIILSRCYFHDFRLVENKIIWYTFFTYSFKQIHVISVDLRFAYWFPSSSGHSTFFLFGPLMFTERINYVFRNKSSVWIYYCLKSNRGSSSSVIYVIDERVPYYVYYVLCIF
jgi:hypothetical protein